MIKISQKASFVLKILISLIGVGLYLGVFFYIQSAEPKYIFRQTNSEISIASGVFVEPLYINYPPPTPEPKDYAALESSLCEMLANKQGDWSLYFLNYNDGNEISINSHRVYSASLIKLYVIQAVYQRVANGSMADTAGLENLLARMITYSDNEAWRTVTKMLGGGSYGAGMAYVTQTAAAGGFADSGQFYIGTHKNYNFTSVNDCGAYLRSLLDGTLISPEYSSKILGYLMQQQHRQKIPAGVPEGIVTANKTGELEYNQGDAAIIYSPNATYILVIIGDDLVNAYGTVPFFTELSKTVYDFIN